ncbi:MAG: DUF342 domain-containing protein [Proteobacteria bacterium]|nr:DUF342 domain-containing protein [Pseudomonadota bacterium]
MSENGKTVITSCTSCKAFYQVPETIVGKEVACKKCGQNFVVSILKKNTTVPLICQVILNYNLAGKDLIKLALEEYNSTQTEHQSKTFEDFLVERQILSPESMALAKDISKSWENRQLEKLFAAIAIKAGFTSQDAAKAALKEQAILFKESRKIMPIGDILVKNNELTIQQRDAILKKQNRLDEIKTARPVRSKETPGVPPSPESQHTASPEKPVSTEQLPDHVPDIQNEKKPETENMSASPNDAKDMDTFIEENKGHLFEGNGFEIIVTYDRLNAFFRATDDFDNSIKLYDVQKILDENAITYGVIKNDLIKNLIENSENGKPVFKIAEGTPPENGKEGQIIIYFDTTPRKAGKIKEDGQIDFKDRGDIPHVKEGELMAEKIPSVQGIPGIDVYGDPIPVDQVEDPILLFGANIKFSEDGLKMFAKTKGQPQLSVGGRISVLDELTISGDVGYKTGHVEFDGNILITGAIQNGFKVKGGNVKVKEINGAELELTGSLMVTDGINDAKISALGDVTAKFISKSNITNFGDILVSKMIIDSEISCGGSCKAPGGKIVSSDISAKYGIEAVDIGTSMSRPCKLKAGLDDHLAKEIGGINSAIERHRASIKDCQEHNKNFIKEEEQTHMSIAEQAHIQDRSQIEQRQIREQIKDLQEKGDAKGISLLEAQIRELEKNVRMAENGINLLFDKQERMLESIENNKKRIAALESRLWELTAEKKNILQYAKKEKGIAIIKATGTIYAGTTITGVHSSRIVNESIRRAQIKEVHVTDPDSPVEYEMRLIQ